MGFKKSLVKNMLFKTFKEQTKSLEYNLVIDKGELGPTNVLKEYAKLETKKYLKHFVAGAIVGLCLAQLFVFLFMKILLFYQYNKVSNDHKYVITHFHENEDKTLADQLYNEVRVLCWVMTRPENHQTKAQHVKNTWGPRCNKLIFMSTTEDTKLGTVALPVGEGRNNLWGKTKQAFKYIYKHHFDEYDWFLKADDDTYVIVENLRKMLYSYSTDFPIFLGCRRRMILKQGYMHGGAGYILSKEALKRFIDNGLPNKTNCRQDNDGLEDVELAICMEKLQVLAGDSRDEYERATMFADPPIFEIVPDPVNKPKRYWKALYYKLIAGPDCCSDHAISFHYIKPNNMYKLDYMIYHLKPFGITHAPDILPKKKSLDEVIYEHSIPSVNNVK